ncbi:hypothetical protein N0V90_008227 [Kalmusia sp. IMI 367209]|nr:hypothetical protein N0V90_008227 [Kalmusia sp. IMI 367209]
MAAVVAQTHTRPYRDFLTPVLHKRFTNAASYTLLLCWLISVWQGTWNHYLWSWFPLGPVGIRTLLLFISALIIYTLRIAQYHVGERNRETPLEAFQKYAFTSSTIMTVVCYMLSAFLYGEIYMKSQPEEKKLSYTDQGKNYERIRLNERPMFLRMMFLTLGLVQSTAHLWFDYDRIDFPALKPKNEHDTVTTDPALSPRQALMQKLTSMAKAAGTLASSVSFVGAVVYIAGFRYVVWPWYYWAARSFVSLSKTRPLPVTLPPFLPLVGMFFVEAAFLLFLWKFINSAFNLYMAQPPLKNGNPITNDSKDANGSLLNGLKAKKETVKAVALWELAMITDSIPERRKTIYGELNRKKGATLKQVVDICLAEVNLLINRINVGLDPHYHPKQEVEKNTQLQTVSLVPQIAPPLKDAPIKGAGLSSTTAREKLGDLTADFAKSLSSPQNGQKTRDYLKKGVAEGSQHLRKAAEEAEARSSGFVSQFMASPLGYPFRRSLRRTASIVVTGAPYSRFSILCNAITALTNLTVFSFREDEFGRLQEEVPRIIRVFTEALKKVDEYVAKLEVHWSDFDTLARPADQRKKISEVEEVRECLRSGLEKVIRTFGEYLRGMGMTSVEIQDAKKVAAKGPEMALVR